MRPDDRDDLVGDVADALTLDQPVQWERCARLAAGAERAQIENLRVIERVLASRPAAGAAAETVPATRFYGRAVVRHAVHALIAIASLEVAATLLLLPWAWGDYYRAHGELAVYMTTKLVGHAAGAGLLLWAGRGDWRTWLLGVYSLLKATQAPLHMLPAFLLELPPPQEYAAYLQHLPADSRLFAALYVPAFLFAPAFLWAFARECPRVHRRTWLDDLARRMVPASVLIGGGLWVACAVTLELARAGAAAAPVALVLDGTIAMQDLLVLGAVILVALRAHTASADEVRRVVVFSAGFLLFMGVSAAYDVAEAFAPGDWISNYRWSPTILVMEGLRFPGLILLWYAVLAARIPHLREAVRALYRRLLGPGTDVLGVLVVGRRLDGRVVRTVDLPFLEALGAAAGLALARLELLDAPAAGSGEAPPAVECPVCRSVTEAGAPPECACGSAYVTTEVPKRLAGKFRLTRRLGSGGMGAVYLARDLRLERDVAIKILTARSLGRLRGLTPEAWAMATVTHPAVAQIHGVEVWRGRPCLVVEFLAGGTLEDRLRDGPLAPAQAVSVVARLADALAALHEKGVLHGDIKPSNIGFTAEGAPKLLDFGLAHAVDDAVLVGGTLPYLSPEVLTGRPAAAAAPPAPAAVAAFAAAILTAPRAERPGTAPAFAAALAEVLGTA